MTTVSDVYKIPEVVLSPSSDSGSSSGGAGSTSEKVPRLNLTTVSSGASSTTSRTAEEMIRARAERVASQKPPERLFRTRSVAALNKSAESWTERTAAKLEKRGKLGKVGGAAFRFVEGVVDVGIVKPVGLGLAVADTAVLEAAALVTVLGTGAGYSKKGRQVAEGLAVAGGHQLKSAGCALASAISTTVTGVPRYILKRASRECFDSIKGKLVRFGQKMQTKGVARTRDAGAAQMPLEKRVTAAIDKSGYIHAVNELTGLAGYGRALLAGAGAGAGSSPSPSQRVATTVAPAPSPELVLEDLHNTPAQAGS
ncbi:MAG: hypothetical protein HYX48_08400 [Chlamydiales bacterium]|nr:hypothetical protein [Chlamydiales bacterium]